jgi:hypothetical protein
VRLQTGEIMHVLPGTSKKKLLFTRGDALEFMTGKAVTGTHGYFQNGQPIAIINELDEFSVLPTRASAKSEWPRGCD